jgi:hypothetical protein
LQLPGREALIVDDDVRARELLLVAVREGAATVRNGRRIARSGETNG